MITNFNMIKLTFYGTPISFNEYVNTERTNRYIAAKVKKRETETIALEIKHQKIEPINYKIDVQFIFYSKDMRKDPDSFIYFYKVFFDGLQQAGIIQNDNQKTIGRITQEPIFIDKENPRVEVFITKNTLAK